MTALSPSGATKIIAIGGCTDKPILFFTMDIIHQCLSLAPIPYLAPAFSILRFICSSVEQAQASKQQLRALAQTIAQLLCALNEEYRAGRLVEARTSTSVTNLDRFVSLILSKIPGSH